MNIINKILVGIGALAVVAEAVSVIKYIAKNKDATEDDTEESKAKDLKPVDEIAVYIKKDKHPELFSKLLKICEESNKR